MNGLRRADRTARDFASRPSIDRRGTHPLSGGVCLLEHINERTIIVNLGGIAEVQTFVP